MATRPTQPHTSGRRRSYETPLNEVNHLEVATLSQDVVKIADGSAAESSPGAGHIGLVRREGIGAVRADYFAGSVGVITGAGAGIGRALALQLSARGGRLALWDCDAEAVSQTAAQCRHGGAKVRVDVVDVTDRAAVLQQAAVVGEEFGRVNLVFCVAGVIHTGSVLGSDLDDVHHVVDVNLWGVVHTVKAFLPLVIASGGGHVVTVSSAFGLMAAPRYSAYVASKFAVRGFTEALRQEMELDGHPVRVSCAYPGGVRTQIIRTGRVAAGEDAAAIADRFDRHVARTGPQAAASMILRGTQRGQPQILVGVDARGVASFVRVAGASYQRILPRILRRAGATRSDRHVSGMSDGGGRGPWPNGGY